jgi:hypothetical protein
MEDDLQLYGLKYNVVVMVFFITYAGLEVPCNVHHFSPSKDLKSKRGLSWDCKSLFKSLYKTALTLRLFRSFSRCSVRRSGFLA